jgi:cytochrome c
MFRTRTALIAALSISLSLPAASAFAQDAAAGAKVFDTYCSSCHALGQATVYKAGPSLRGVIGRKAGIQANASLPLKTWGKVWTPALLNAFIADPPGLVPGTIMMISLKDPKKRADLIAFLAQQK